MKEKLEKRISKEDFFKYLDKLKERSNTIHAIYQATDKSLDMINFEDYMLEPYRIIEKNFFSDIELDLINWYLYEYKDGEMQIYLKDSNKEKVIADIKDNEALWNYLNDDENKCWEKIEKDEDEIFTLKDLKEMIFG